MPRNKPTVQTFLNDFVAGLVVFVVALPLSLGVALASDAEPISGLIAGILGGIVVGAISKSHTSVSGSSPGLSAVICAQLAVLGSFEAFLAAVAVAGLMQIAMGLGKAGFLSAFVPTSVIKGLLAAVGVLLILKQIPHLVGHDPDPDGEMSFFQPDAENTFSALVAITDDFQWGAALIGMVCLGLLIAWESSDRLRKSNIPGQLVVVMVGVALSELFKVTNETLAIDESHMVQVPLSSPTEWVRCLDFTTLTRPAVWQAGFILALVASLETLLNLEAVDKIDPYARTSPPNRELIAQGIGNVMAGLLGGLPMSSAIVRSSVNINAGAKTRWATIIHGLFLAGAVMLCPSLLNRIPLSCLAAILLFTGFKLAAPKLVRDMWAKGPNQFAPFAFTVVAIVFTNLLVGVIAGLFIAITFILWSNVRRPLRRVIEKHAGAQVMRLELANQVSFLNRAAIDKLLDEVPEGGHLLIDASGTDYIDPDILDIIQEFEQKTSKARNISVSLTGFHDRYNLEDRIQFVDYTTRDLQKSLTPQQVMHILRDGNKRFRSGERLTRDLGRQVEATSTGQFPLAAVLSCMDSRAPAEILFDLGVGDIFSIRIAGNVASSNIIGSLEYACAVAGSKLILVLGHSRCGAVTAAVENARSGKSIKETTGCEHLAWLVQELRQSIDGFPVADSPESMTTLVEEASLRNVLRAIDTIRRESTVLASLEAIGRIAIIGAKYDIVSGKVDFMAMEETMGVFDASVQLSFKMPPI